MSMPEPRNGGSQTAGDRELSRAFLSTIEAAYRGMWAFERALMELGAEVDRSEELDQAERVLETVAEWWRRLESGSPIFRQRDRPVLQGPSSRAWRLLQVAESRLRSLIGDLTGTTDVDRLAADRWARTVRLATLIELAEAQHTTIAGLVRRAEAEGDLERARQWRQRLLATEESRREARSLAEELGSAADADFDEELAHRLYDATLLAPAQVAQRVIDISQVFSLYTGSFDYEDAGIPDAQVDDWAAYGFTPEDAGRWFAAGLTPARAATWISAGAPDPLIAAGFLWRGFSPEEAGSWLGSFIEGRRAAAWQAAGCDPQDAREWIALGVRDPGRVASFPAATRLM